MMVRSTCRILQGGHGLKQSWCVEFNIVDRLCNCYQVEHFVCLGTTQSNRNRGFIFIKHKMGRFSTLLLQTPYSTCTRMICISHCATPYFVGSLLSLRRSKAYLPLGLLYWISLNLSGQTGCFVSIPFSTTS
jgi:hypothetical protein